MFHQVVKLAVALVAVATAAEVYAPTAYGRFASSTGAVVELDPRIGWWLMECPCWAVFIYQFFYKSGRQAKQFVPRLLALLFCCHYLYRGWLFPALMRPHSSGTKSFSLFVALGSWLVTVTHGYLNARWYAEHGTHLAAKPNSKDKQRSHNWLHDGRFWIGLVMYLSGFAMIVWHDKLMRDLRVPGAPRYSIPRGGLFDYVTAGHYLAELWAWAGFAIMSWGPNGLFIFAISLGNLVPRAASTHAWYLQHFGDEYAALQRHRLVPGVW